ncbi:MAG: holo-ACP synthase [Rickettsiales bacterium]|jgi:holo-[acyl-carrier protein] synthase|nr:holo-ACP synthase [Rickettsiales bacterium]
MKIFGVGIDLLNSDRVARLYSDYGSRLLQKVLSPDEMALVSREKSVVRKTINFVAKRFSAKEALLKAMGIGMGRGLGLTDVSVLSGNFGQPTISLSEKSENFLQKFYDMDIENLKFNISITDEVGLINSIVIISAGGGSDR